MPSITRPIAVRVDRRFARGHSHVQPIAGAGTARPVPRVAGRWHGAARQPGLDGPLRATFRPVTLEGLQRDRVRLGRQKPLVAQVRRAMSRWSLDIENVAFRGQDRQLLANHDLVS